MSLRCASCGGPGSVVVYPAGTAYCRTCHPRAPGDAMFAANLAAVRAQSGARWAARRRDTKPIAPSLLDDDHRPVLVQQPGQGDQILAVIGILFKRGLVVALGYAFAIEVMLANFPGSASKLTVQSYLRAILLEGRTGRFGIDVEVIAGCVHITATLVPELDAEVGLVRTLVAREAGVAINAKHRAADRARISGSITRRKPR